MRKLKLRCVTTNLNIDIATSGVRFGTAASRDALIVDANSCMHVLKQSCKFPSEVPSSLVQGPLTSKSSQGWNQLTAAQNQMHSIQFYRHSRNASHIVRAELISLAQLQA